LVACGRQLTLIAFPFLRNLDLKLQEEVPQYPGTWGPWGECGPSMVGDC